MLWPYEQNLMYEFYDRSNSTYTINHLENLRYVMKNNGWKRIVLVWDNASYHLSKITREYVYEQKKRLAHCNRSSKEGSVSIQMKESKSEDKIRCLCK